MADIGKGHVKQLKVVLTEMPIYANGMTNQNIKNDKSTIKNTCTDNKKHAPSNQTDDDSGMKRKYVNVLERRMPWCLFPVPKQLTLQQRTNILSAYKEQQNICRYRKAKSSPVFAEWEIKNCIRISNKEVPIETKSSSQYSRSGRLLNTCPQYTEQLSDSEISPSKRKNKKRFKKLTNEEIMTKSSLFQDDDKNGDNIPYTNEYNYSNYEVNFNTSSRNSSLNNNTSKKRDANDESNVANDLLKDKKRMKVSER